MRRLALVAALALVAFPLHAQNQTADDAFTAIYTAEWQWRQSLSESDDSHVAAHMPDVSPAAQQAQLKYWQGIETRLAAIDTTKLSPANRDNFAVYKTQIDAFVAAQLFREYEKPVNSDSAFWSDLTYPAPADFRTAQDYHNYIGQLEEIPRYFAQQVLNRRPARRGASPRPR
jgi:uncharacterized protein (DUF885 family)